MHPGSIVAALVSLCVLTTTMAASAEPTMIEETWSARGLHGTYARPQSGPDRGLAVLIIAGSGPTDRDGNGPGLATDTYRKLAEGFAASGIRSLRYDKRGIGASRSLVTREEDVAFEDFVSDAVDIARDLATRPDVSSVLLAGHSEGAIIALAAAKNSRASGLILLCSPGRDFLSVLRAQLKGKLPPDLDSRATSILDALSAGQRVADIPQALQALFRPSVQPFLISAARYDPAAMIAATDIGVLVLHAGRDLQIMPEDLARLRASKPQARFVVLPEANHTLKSSPDDLEGNIALYKNPDAALDPGLLPPIVEFVRSTAR